MISLPLIKKELKSNLIIFLIFAAVLSMYTSVMVGMFDPQLGKMLDMFAKEMPEIMSAFGMGSTGSTLLEFLITYFYGMLALIFPLVFIVMLTNRLIAKYIDNGSMAYLIGTPNSRQKIVFTQMIFIWKSIVLLIFVFTLVGIGMSGILFPGDLDIPNYILVNVGLCILHFAISGFCFFISCTCDTKKVSAITIGVPVAFYIIQMLANMGGKLENLKYITIFTLFDPSGLIHGEYNAYLGILILFFIGVVFYFLAVHFFKRRDLSI